MTNPIIKLMLVDDHEVVRVGLRSLLSVYDHIEVVAEACHAEEAIRFALEKKPDIILMDVRMPGQSGVDACREILKHLPSTHVIMLTSYDDEEIIYQSILAGASGYILKEINSQDLIHAIEAVSEGKSLLDPAITTKVLQKIRRSNEEDHKLHDLTPQEKQVLTLISQGMTNREIAETMMLSEKTIRNYVSQILSKLEVHNRAEAAAFAVRHHLEE
ncbi:response regulator transcription factor [Microaerobacter geothermalis]|uniref:response regulator transcription factor n=1 Tax=Microaerobacter geothermalis TaxID=674972 RepID=UPI001F2EF483|nr:response regulator transcription factor [Microaerobacter geothermalis]MCF6094914.1 response regulator transcription factor [Microaerobacter geothermalis]